MPVKAELALEYADFADFWNPLRGGEGLMGAYVESLPPEKRRLIKDRVRAAFRQRRPTGSGR